MSSFHQMYPKIENIFPGTTSDFQTFISLLNSLSLTDSLMFCMRVNHILLDWNKTHEDKQRNIAQLFFSEEEIGKMFTGSPRISSFSELLIVSKGSITHLARWIVMYCQDQEGDGTTFKDPKIRQIFAKALLIINDVWSQDIQMEHMLDDVPIEETRYNLLSTFRQNSAGSHIPTQHGSLSIGKGVSMFIDPGYFGNQHPEFAKQFQQVTGISIEDYYICHTYLTSNTNSKVDGKALFEFEQAVNSVAEEFRPIFASFLELESQDISDLRKAFWGDFEKESLSDFSDAPPFNDRELRTRPFFRTQDGRIIIIDPGLYFDKITDGPLFTMFGVGKAEYFIHKFGYAFEKAVHDYLRKLYPISPLNDRLSCPLMRQAIGTEPSSVELTDACLDYGEEMIIFEIKASFLRQDTVLENDNEKYVAMLREKYVLTSDGEPKGVTQLANTIIGLENDKYEAVDRDFSIVSKIFPVLLVHDELIDAPMHPHFFANEFIQALKPDEVLQNGFLKKGRFLVAPIALMTFEDLENLEFSIRRNGFSLKDALQRYIEMYPDRLQSFHNFCVEAQYQPYAGQIFAQVNLDFLAKTKDRLFPQNQDG